MRARVASFALIGLFTIALLTMSAFAYFQQDHDEYETRAAPGNVRFIAVDLIIDARHHALAAWQVEFTAPQHVRIVGIENGEFADEPPHYDPAAMMNNRVVLAQFSLDDEEGLASGEMRLATLHLRMEGEIDLGDIELELAAAANARGERIANAEIRLEIRDE